MKAGIQGQQIPPLSQSRYGDMACETLYVQKHVQGTILGESEPAARGIEIHQALASYIDHLVTTRHATDLEVFDALMKGDSAGNLHSRLGTVSQVTSVRDAGHCGLLRTLLHGTDQWDGRGNL